MEGSLSHLDEQGRPKMVDVSLKPETPRRALARAELIFSPSIRDRVLAGDVPKGAVLDTARLAGIGGAKRTADLIPLCHPLRLTEVAIRFAPLGADGLEIFAEVRAHDRTGVEMEALTAVTVAGLCVYDMVKAVDPAMVLREIRLLEKDGGRRGSYRATGCCP